MTRIEDATATTTLPAASCGCCACAPCTCADCTCCDCDSCECTSSWAGRRASLQPSLATRQAGRTSGLSLFAQTPAPDRDLGLPCGIAAW